MRLSELAPGLRVRLRAVPLTVSSVDASGAILQAPGRWAVYRVASDGALWAVEPARAADGRGRRRPPRERATSYTLADVEPASC